MMVQSPGSTPAGRTLPLLVIDVDEPGKLRRSETPYDARVAGVVSGAGGVRAGFLF